MMQAGAAAGLLDAEKKRSHLQRQHLPSTLQLAGTGPIAADTCGAKAALQHPQDSLSQALSGGHEWQHHLQAPLLLRT